MIDLYVNGQDIRRIVFGLAKNGEVQAVRSFDVGPEGDLGVLDGFLGAHKCALDELTRIITVVGPGSATALRSSLSIVNAIAFAREIPIVPIEQGTDEQDIDSFTHALSTSADQSTTDFAYPKYSTNPKITFSTRDALRRKPKKV